MGGTFSLFQNLDLSALTLASYRMMLSQLHEPKGVFPFLWEYTGFPYLYIIKGCCTVPTATLMKTTVAKTQMA